jgi:hypothetical protein
MWGLDKGEFFQNLSRYPHPSHEPTVAFEWRAAHVWNPMEIQAPFSASAS